MEIIFNETEEKAISDWAKLNGVTYKEALDKFIKAMQNGLNELNKNHKALDSGPADPSGN